MVPMADIQSVTASKLSAKERALAYFSYSGGPQAYAVPNRNFGHARLQVVPWGHPLEHPFCHE